MNNFLEKTLENIIMANLDKMPSKGLDIFYKNTVNQIAFRTFIADIFTWEEVDDILYCRIIELKREKVDEHAFWQVFNYKIDLFLFIFDKYKYIKDIKIEIVLIGTSFNDNVEFISNYTGLKLYKYNYNIDGVFFEYNDSDFNDNVINAFYKNNLLKGIDLSKSNSFTDDAIKLARGKVSS